MAKLVLAAADVAATENSAPGVTYVIPIKDMIERGLVHLIERGVAQANAEGADAIILDMDTPGGRLDATEKIITTITDTKATTYTLVNPDAISAGAITAMATDYIYMTPGGRIGDAMPIMMSPLPMGGPQEVPDGLKEKMVSPTVAMIRSAAQRKGHDEKLAEAMVRPEIEYAIGDKIICPAGQLLTLTAKDAAQLVGEGSEQRPLLSSGTVDDLQALLKLIGRENDRLVIIEPTAGEKIARVIESFPVSGILLGLGLLFLYIEFKTPGLGLPGLAGITFLAIWFWGHHVAGLANLLEMTLFMIGVILLLVEIFVIPGFGFTGVTGITLMVVAVLMGMIEVFPAPPSVPRIAPLEMDIYKMVFNFGTAMLLTLVLGALVTRFLPRTDMFWRIALKSAVSKEQGYEASHGEEYLVGAEGVAVTPLHPAGIGEFGDRRRNVITRGDFIEQDSPIVVAEVHGNRIVVDARQGT